MSDEKPNWPFLKVRTNSLRRNDDKHFVLNSKSIPNALCLSCAYSQSCQTHHEALKQNEHVHSCASHVPVLRFVSTRNLDKNPVNTIRLGSAWLYRSGPGEEIGLYCAETDALYSATVKELVYFQSKTGLLTHHAHLNHLGMDCKNPPVDMVKILQNTSGKGFYERARGLTAIYLENFKPILQRSDLK